MDSFRDLLAQFEPEGLGAEGPGWQQRKSAQMRIGILEAAIDCLAKHGFARTTTQMIAETAKISRGAMLHHYPTKTALIEAIISYSVYKRIERLGEGVRKISERQRVEEYAGLDILWDIFLSREYRAYLEMNVASRTDAKVRDTFLPLARRFAEVRRAETARIFPEWARDPLRLARASDFAEAFMEGLALNAEVWDSPERIDRMRALLRRMIAMIDAGELNFRPDPPSLRDDVNAA